MSYTNLISCHVSDAVRTDFYALAKSRDVTVASLLRQMIVREIHSPADRAEEMWRHSLFNVIALDYLLSEHSNTALRAAAIATWQERIDREDHRGD